MSKRSRPSSSSRPVTRRELLGALGAAPLALAGGEAEAQRVVVRPRSSTLPLDPGAGGWRPWLAATTHDLRPPAPPDGRGELQAVLNAQLANAGSGRALVRAWESQGGVPRWTRALLEVIQQSGTNPVRAARAMALVQAAVADAALLAWEAKFTYHRPPPWRLSRQIRPFSSGAWQLPSYPSEHAAVAAAAAGVLEALFPGQTVSLHARRVRFADAAREASESRLVAGANYRSDLEAGSRIGAAVAALAVARSQSDGEGAVWDAQTRPGRREGPACWVPTPPVNTYPPLEPLAGTWKPWLMTSGHQFRPPAPCALQGEFPCADFLAEVKEVKDAVDSLSADHRQIALYWADNPGQSATPPGHWLRIGLAQSEAAGLSAPRAARHLALLAVGLADAAISCWDCKFTYWLLRPVTAIRTLKGQPFYDPNFNTVIPTPPFPAYTSGHATFSGCAAAILEHLFPGGRTEDAFEHSVRFQEAAEQAARSRLYGGIHYRSDNEEGLKCGAHIASLVLRRAKEDGAG
jgi:hypothetical protein